MTNLSWLICESVKTLEINTSVLYNLVFANNAILSCYFFFLIFDSYFLLATVIVKIFNLIAELVIPIGIASKEAKAGIETHSVIAEVKIRNFSIYFKIVKNFLCSYSSIHSGLFL